MCSNSRMNWDPEMADAADHPHFIQRIRAWLTAAAHSPAVSIGSQSWQKVVAEQERKQSCKSYAGRRPSTRKSTHCMARSDPRWEA